MKTKQCLACMKYDRSAGLRKAKNHESKEEYTDRRDKVRVLQERNFMPPILDPDLFLGIPDNVEREEHSIFCAEIDEENE